MGNCTRPTALIKEHLPARGLGDHPADADGRDGGCTTGEVHPEAIKAIQCDSEGVFDVQPQERDAQARRVVHYLDLASWAQLSGFGRFIRLGESVSDRSGMHAPAIGDDVPARPRAYVRACECRTDAFSLAGRHEVDAVCMPDSLHSCTGGRRHVHGAVMPRLAKKSGVYVS